MNKNSTNFKRIALQTEMSIERLEETVNKSFHIINAQMILLIVFLSIGEALAHCEKTKSRP